MIDAGSALVRARAYAAQAPAVSAPAARASAVSSTARTWASGYFRRVQSAAAPGQVVATAPWTGITPGQLAEVIGRFRGGYEQTPPAYSAVKVAGERAYRRARRGEEVALEPRAVEIRELEIVEAAVPDLRFRATVSAGTYLRSLARDIGAARP